MKPVPGQSRNLISAGAGFRFLSFVESQCQAADLSPERVQGYESG